MYEALAMAALSAVLLVVGTTRLVRWFDDRAYRRQVRRDEELRLLAEAREYAEAHRVAEDCQ